MTTMIAELYDALIAAGSPEDKARKAAETVAACENRFAGFDLKLSEIKGDLTLVKSMLGLIIARLVSLVMKTFI